MPWTSRMAGVAARTRASVRGTRPGRVATAGTTPQSLVDVGSPSSQVTFVSLVYTDDQP